MHEHDDSGMAQAMSESANCADLHQHGNDTPARAAAACSGQPDCWAWVPRSTRPRRRSPTKNPTGTRDSQYLFDEDRGDSRPLDASLDCQPHRRREHRLPHPSGRPDPERAGRRVRRDRAGAAHSVLAGNHDIRSNTDDQRGDSPYLRTFGPSQFRTTNGKLLARTDPTPVGPGLLGRTIDPHGPIRHDPGNGGPWRDTWFYPNPIFVDVR